MIATQSAPPQIYVPVAKRRFTKAEVAEITRGATIRVRKPVPDRLAKAVAKLEKCIKAYKDAQEDVRRTEAAMGDAGAFGYWIDCTIYRPLFTSHCTVLSIDDIDRALKCVSLRCRQERSHYRSYRCQCCPLTSGRRTRQPLPLACRVRPVTSCASYPISGAWPAVLRPCSASETLLLSARRRPSARKGRSPRTETAGRPWPTSTRPHCDPWRLVRRGGNEDGQPHRRSRSADPAADAVGHLQRV